MRISGLSGSGLDIDGIVSETMQPYKMKVTNKIKERKLLEVKQSLYQDIIESGRKIYEKYLKPTSANSLINPNNYNSVSFLSNSSAVSVKNIGGAEKENYSVRVTQLASKATKIMSNDQLVAGQTVTITSGDETRTFTLEGNNKSEIADDLNRKLSEAGFNMTAKYSDFANSGNGGMKIQTNALGEESNFTISIGNGAAESVQGRNAIADITNTSGETVHYTGSDNKVTLDNVEFTFNDVTAGSASIIGETDVTAIKERIISFVNDYNEFITDLNTKIGEKRNKDYLPLTDEEKSSMSETQIKLWEEKVKTGLLRNDLDLSRIANTLKDTMKTVISGSGLKLEDIGIKPVKDYKEKNGTYTIDEQKLTEALQNNIQGVKDIFTSESNTTTLPNGSSYVSGGIITTLEGVFKTEFVYSSNSELIKKAGTKNSSLNSTITEQLAKQQQVIDNMNAALTKREDKLYLKYSKLESALGNLYAQQNWLAQQFSY